MTVESGGQVAAPVAVQVTDAAPGIFTEQPLGKAPIRFECG